MTENLTDRPRWSLLRGLSGILAVGEVVLLLIVLGAVVVSWVNRYPGPVWWAVGWHAVAAILAITFQRFADRHQGFTSWMASSVVIILTVVTLWFFWWL